MLSSCESFLVAMLLVFGQLRLFNVVVVVQASPGLQHDRAHQIAQKGMVCRDPFPEFVFLRVSSVEYLQGQSTETLSLASIEKKLKKK